MPIPHLSSHSRFNQKWRKERNSPLLDKKAIKTLNKKKRIKKRKIILLFITFFILIILGGSITGLGALAWLSRGLPQPDKIIDRSLTLSTKIYDRSGKVMLYEIHGEQKRTMVNLKDLPPYVIFATLVIEDKNFYKHSGFDLKGIIRALLINTLTQNNIQGGSTVTQQLIKNTILTKEKTYKRKIRELILAFKLERKFTKEEILKMYFNEVPYGSTIYGIEAAALSYFNKNAKDLAIDEAALLSALPKAPSYYSPYGSHRDELLARQHYILDSMEENGYINSLEKEQAKKTDTLSKISPNKERMIAPHLVMYVKELLEEKYGPSIVNQEGLRVYTTLDLAKQRIAERAIKEGVEKNKKFKATNAALVSLDPKTGQILTMVGSRDYFEPKFGAVNVTLRPRQPGSSFKPVVYAAAFKKGYTPQTLLYDLETVFKSLDGNQPDYHPKNYDGKEHGLLTMKKALAGSLNIPAVKTLYLTGINNVLDLATDLGYTTFKDRSRFGLSLVLGGGEVKLLEHTAGLGAFAREGLFQLPTTILKIEDKDGRLIEEGQPQVGQPVIDTQIARQINDILSDNNARSFIFGAQNYLTLPDRPVAVKTGTTDDFRDAWTIGWTPSLVTGVWVGNNDNSPMVKGADGSKVAAPIWQKFMKDILKDTPVETFKTPEAVVTTKPILSGSDSGMIKAKIDKASGKLATDLTPASFVEEKIYKQTHNILYYVNKDNPTGAVPEHPENDPQYENWEKAVQAWVKKQNITQESPPTQYDDLHTKENKPQITLLSPLPNISLSQSNLIIEAQITAPRGINKTEFYIDDQLMSGKTMLLAKEQNIKINTEIDLSSLSLENGFHSLKIVAYDDIDNRGSYEVNFNLLR